MNILQQALESLKSPAVQGAFPITQVLPRLQRAYQIAQLDIQNFRTNPSQTINQALLNLNNDPNKLMNMVMAVSGGMRDVSKLRPMSLAQDAFSDWDTAVDTYKGNTGSIDDIAQARKTIMSEAQRQLTPEELSQKTDTNDIIDLVQKRIKPEEKGIIAKTKGIQPVLDTLNPTGKLYTDYNPQSRMTMKLGKNITTYDKTAGLNPNDEITIYRGASKNHTKINPGDFITTKREVAESYTGDKNILELKVKAKDILDDITEPLGDEYIYRPSNPNVAQLPKGESMSKAVKKLK